MINIIKKLFELATPFTLKSAAIELCGGKISSMPLFDGRFSCRPLISGELNSKGVIGCSKFEAHICRGQKT